MRRQPTGLRGQALRLDGQFEAAVTEYDRGVAAEPLTIRPLAGRRVALAGLGQAAAGGGEVAFLLGDIAAVRDHVLRAVAAELTSAAVGDLLARAELAAGSPTRRLNSVPVRALDKSRTSTCSS